MSATTPPAGWYADPSGMQGSMRYWSGTEWTEHRHHVEPTAKVEAPAEIQPADDGVLVVKGRGGTVAFDGQFVTISRSGALGRLVVGKGDKRVPIGNVTAVQVKPAGPVMNGFIQFTIPGSNEVRSQFGRQTFDAAGDENSVIFTRKQQAAFEAFRDAVQQGISDFYAGQRASAQPVAAAASVATQIRELAELHSAGALSDEEFAQAKAKLLG